MPKAFSAWTVLKQKFTLYIFMTSELFNTTYSNSTYSHFRSTTLSGKPRSARPELRPRRWPVNSRNRRWKRPERRGRAEEAAALEAVRRGRGHHTYIFVHFTPRHADFFTWIQIYYWFFYQPAESYRAVVWRCCISSDDCLFGYFGLVLTLRWSILGCSGTFRYLFEYFF